MSIESLYQPIVNMANPLLPVNMRAGQPDDCPISLPNFHGNIESNRNKHVSEFLTACNANNIRTDVHWYAISPTTLKDHAK